MIYILACCLQLFQIDCEEYGEALALAKAYKLDCDMVYQRQWRRKPATVATIQDYLVRTFNLKKKKKNFNIARQRG